MLKKMNVTVEIVEEDACESDIKENVNNLSYLSKKDIKFVDCEFIT